MQLCVVMETKVATAMPLAGSAAGVVLEGRITAYTAGPVWHSALDTIAKNADRRVVVDASRLKYSDNVGISCLCDLVRRQRPKGANVEWRHLDPRFAALVAAYDPKDFAQPAKARRHVGMFEHMGRASEKVLDYVEKMVSFSEECAAAARSALRIGA